MFFSYSDLYPKTAGISHRNSAGRKTKPTTLGSWYLEDDCGYNHKVGSRSSIAKLVYHLELQLTRVIVHGVYKPTNNWVTQLAAGLQFLVLSSDKLGYMPISNRYIYFSHPLLWRHWHRIMPLHLTGSAHQLRLPSTCMIFFNNAVQLHRFHITGTQVLCAFCPNTRNAAIAQKIAANHTPWAKWESFIGNSCNTHSMQRASICVSTATGMRGRLDEGDTSLCNGAITMCSTQTCHPPTGARTHTWHPGWYHYHKPYLVQL